MTYLTADLPGTGGHYKELPEDFWVEEIPRYPCSGVGEHLYLWVEKEGISTRDLLGQLSRGLQLPERELGYAGLKDARARTRQMISIPAGGADRLEALQLQRARILRVERHANKLRLGHLAGNRFSIRLRDVHPEAAARAQAICRVLQQQGVPNRFGEQRYGVLGNSAQLGLLLARGEYEEFGRELLGDPAVIRNPDWQAAAIAFRAGQLRQCLAALPQRMRDEQRLIRSLLQGKTAAAAVLDLPRNLLRLFLSACQSQLFDQLLEQRLPDLHQLEDGDIAVKHDNGACFRVVSGRAEQERADRFEISPSAPLFGTKMMLAEGAPGEREERLLKESGLTLETWKIGAGLNMPGERRPLRVPLQEPRIEALEGNQLQLFFALPKGSYATSVLQELIK
jgi:tRNA pseudouridine13 synthase